MATLSVVGFFHETMATETILGMLALWTTKKNKSGGLECRLVQSLKDRDAISAIFLIPILFLVLVIFKMIPLLIL